MTSGAQFGLVQDTPDFRDYPYVPTLTSFPGGELHVRPYPHLGHFYVPVKNQGNLNSCTGFAVTSMIEMVRKHQGFVEWDVSPMFTWYATRKIEGTTDQNVGAQLRNALKSVVQDGVVPETTWPYIESLSTTCPPVSAWEQAQQHQTLKYYRINNTNRDNLLACIAEGYPFVFGVKVFESFTRNEFFSVIHRPDPSREKFLGGHAMVATGYMYYPEQNCFQIVAQNSWGDQFGNMGYIQIDGDYLTDPAVALDFWTIRLEEADDNDLKKIDDDNHKPVEPPVVVTPPEPQPTPVPEPPAPVIVPEPVVVEPVEPPKPAPVIPLEPLPQPRDMTRAYLVTIMIILLMVGAYIMFSR